MKESAISKSLLFIILLGLVANNSFAQEEFEGFPYDPDGATVTTDKEIQQQHKRTIGYADDGIWVSNEFAGARMSDLKKISEDHYRILVKPEIQPINNSPWYAFKIQSDSARTVTVELSYEHGHHRYSPKLSTDGERWKSIPADNYSSDGETATLQLDVDKDPLWVSAQELKTASDFNKWIHMLATHPDASLEEVGYSHDGHPIQKMTISTVPGNLHRGVLIITGRQHPPEITGALASQVFLETLLSDHPIANQFRQHFVVWAYPFINPDGVQRGHWRQNAVGVDLNRDWKAFNQPETKSIRDDLLTLKEDSLRKVFYAIDFHSTNSNIFYPIKRDISTFPEDFTYQWLNSLSNSLADFNFTVEPFDTHSPITKNWIFHTFGADAVTYEMDDDIDREKLDMVVRESALILMRQLLNKKNQKSLLLSRE